LGRGWQPGRGEAPLDSHGLNGMARAMEQLRKVELKVLLEKVQALGGLGFLASEKKQNVAHLKGGEKHVGGKHGGMKSDV